MVQGGLLTVHPGSIHGGGEAPEGGSSLRQGAGKRSAGAPDLGSAAAAEQRRDHEKGFFFEGFSSRRIYRRRGQPGGPPGVQAPPRRGQPLGRATRAPGPLVVALWPHSGSSGRFFCADFLSDFSRIFGELFIWGKTEIEKQQKTGTDTVVH